MLYLWKNIWKMLEAETSVEKQSGTKSSTTDKEAGEYLMMGGRGGQINYSLIKTEVYFSLTWNNLKKKKKRNLGLFYQVIDIWCPLILQFIIPRGQPLSSGSRLEAGEKKMPVHLSL